jgi:hypothetical protein
MLKKLTALLVCPLCLSACQELALQGYRGAAPNMTASPVVSEQASVSEPEPPRFSADDGRIAQDYRGLEAWWSFFNDSVLNSLISSGLSLNAAQLGAKTAFPNDNMIKVTLESYYEDKRVGLVNAIAKDYIEYRYIQIQNNLLDEYINRLELDSGEAVGSEGKRIRTELEYLAKKKQEFAKELLNVSVSLSKSTKLLPEYIDEILKADQKIPDYDITPIMASSALILANAAKIDAARTMLYYKSQGQIALQETQDMLPDIRLNQLFGVSENIFVNTNSPWRVKIGNAQKQVDYSSLILHLVHRQLVEDFEDVVNSYVNEIESMLVNIATLHDQQEVLNNAIAKASREDIYKARLASLRAEYEKTKAIVNLFERLDLY